MIFRTFSYVTSSFLLIKPQVRTRLVLLGTVGCVAPLIDDRLWRVFNRKMGVFDGIFGVFEGHLPIFDKKMGVFDKKMAVFRGDLANFDRKMGVFKGDLTFFDGKFGIFDHLIHTLQNNPQISHQNLTQNLQNPKNLSKISPKSPKIT
jgi:hypothetical protein